MEALKGKSVKIYDGELRRRERANREYLMRLKSRNLLVNFQLEAGRYPDRDLPADAHGGWESPVC